MKKMDRSYFYRKKNRMDKYVGWFNLGINGVTEFQSVSSLFTLKQVVESGIQSWDMVNRIFKESEESLRYSQYTCEKNAIDQ